MVKQETARSLRYKTRSALRNLRKPSPEKYDLVSLPLEGTIEHTRLKYTKKIRAGFKEMTQASAEENQRARYFFSIIYVPQTLPEASLLIDITRKLEDVKNEDRDIILKQLLCAEENLLREMNTLTSKIKDCNYDVSQETMDELLEMQRIHSTKHALSFGVKARHELNNIDFLVSMCERVF